MLYAVAMANGNGEPSRNGIWQPQVTAGNVINAGILIAAVITLVLQFNGAISQLESRVSDVAARVQMNTEQIKQIEAWQHYMYQQKSNGGPPQP